MSWSKYTYYLVVILWDWGRRGGGWGHDDPELVKKIDCVINACSLIQVGKYGDRKFCKIILAF